jgi:hypothetical protein
MAVLVGSRATGLAWERLPPNGLTRPHDSISLISSPDPSGCTQHGCSLRAEARAIK